MPGTLDRSLSVLNALVGDAVDCRSRWPEGDREPRGGGEGATWTPLSLSLAMRAAMPGSDLLVLPAGTHTGPLEYPDLVAHRLEKFLAERVEASPLHHRLG